MESALINKAELEVSRYKDPNAEKDIKFTSAPAYITSVAPWSLAREIGLEIGDQILEINGHKLRDIFDFQFHFNGSSEVSLLIRRKNEELEFEIEKDPEDELGVDFHTPFFNGVQECANKCPFCFIEQQPFENTRETLHLRDDDFRLSYLHGSYVTLTNLSYSDRRRIEALRPGPLYVSVHATDIALRNQLLGRVKSIPIMEELAWLASLEIPVHTQIVLCPEINDGEHLRQTISDLFTMRNSPVQSVAVVPVGLTKYNRSSLRRFTLDEALETINIVEAWENEDYKNRANFVFLSDEFFLMTHSSIPEQRYYGDYPQLEDGVGMTRLFLNEFDSAMAWLETQSPSLSSPRKFAWINGTISEPIVKSLALRLNNQLEKLNTNRSIEAFCLQSEFWGITNVSGLLTGKDIIQALKYIPKSTLGDALIIPKVMLKDNSDIFLDDLTLDDVSQAIGLPCYKVWGAQELIELVISNVSVSLES